MSQNHNFKSENSHSVFDVIIIGGSYSGLSAALALGRSLRSVLIIDSGKPCNIQTPHSHNFLTQDGSSPKEISEKAKLQVLAYKTVQFENGLVVHAEKIEDNFLLKTDLNGVFKAKKLIFATGLKDNLLPIEGFAACWGISILHCPYCHGFEVKSKKTAILSNGEFGFEFAKLITNWTKSLQIFTNGKSDFSAEQVSKLKEYNIEIVSDLISKVNHNNGQIESLQFDTGKIIEIEAMYAKLNFTQHCKIPEDLGCILTEQGLLQVDIFQKTNIPGIYACGDNCSMRSLAFAVSSGSMSGVMANKDLIFEAF